MIKGKGRREIERYKGNKEDHKRERKRRKSIIQVKWRK
jgi:hypothetical protein